MTAPSVMRRPVDTDWHHLAACREADPNLFFPERGVDIRPAIAICQQCAVRNECLDHALTHREVHGIWGGTSERQRRVMRRGGRLSNRGRPARRPLTDDQVRDIRARRGYGQAVDLAIEHDISIRTVYAIWNYETYKDVI